MRAHPNHLAGFVTLLAACAVNVPAEPPRLVDASQGIEDSGTPSIDARVVHDAGLSDYGAPRDVPSPPRQDSGSSDAETADEDAGPQRCGNPFDCPRGFFCTPQGFCEPNPTQEDAGPPPPHDDHGDSMDRATPIVPNQPAPGILERNRDQDFFRLLVLVPGWYRIFTRGETDTFCHLLAQNGEEQQRDDDSGDRFNCLIETELNAGTYGIKVRHFSHEGRGAYTLHVTGPGVAPPVCGNGQVEAPEACDDGNRVAGDGCSPNCTLEELPPGEDDHSDTGARATEIRLNQRANGNLETVGDVDYFVFTAERDSRVLAGTLGTTDTRCQAELVQGDVIDVDADSGPGNNCRLAFSARAGRPVYLRVEGERAAVRGTYTFFIATE